MPSAIFKRILSPSIRMMKGKGRCMVFAALDFNQNCQPKLVQICAFFQNIFAFKIVFIHISVPLVKSTSLKRKSQMEEALPLNLPQSPPPPLDLEGLLLFEGY